MKLYHCIDERGRSSVVWTTYLVVQLPHEQGFILLTDSTNGTEKGESELTVFKPLRHEEDSFSLGAALTRHAA